MTLLGLLVSVLFPTITWGGQINGTLFRDGQPVANEEVRIRCGQDAQCVKTDSQGRFTFFVRQTGICHFEIRRTGATHKIISYQLPVRYDFDIFRETDDQDRLRRR